MREIKFRGKRLDNGEWIFGDLHIRSCNPHIHSDFLLRQLLTQILLANSLEYVIIMERKYLKVIL